MKDTFLNFAWNSFKSSITWTVSWTNTNSLTLNTTYLIFCKFHLYKKKKEKRKKKKERKKERKIPGHSTFSHETDSNE